jgi:hypothetical protein
VVLGAAEQGGARTHGSRFAVTIISATLVMLRCMSLPQRAACTVRLSAIAGLRMICLRTSQQKYPVSGMSLILTRETFQSAS